MSPSAPCSRRWRAQFPEAMPPPTSRYSTERSAMQRPLRGQELVYVHGDLLSLVLLEEVGGAFDYPQLLRARDQVHEPLAGLGRKDRVRVREADHGRLLPERETLTRGVHLGDAGRGLLCRDE